MTVAMAALTLHIHDRLPGQHHSTQPIELHNGFKTDERETSTHRLRRRPTEQRLTRGIPQLHQPRLINDIQRQRGTENDCLQQLVNRPFRSRLTIPDC